MWTKQSCRNSISTKKLADGFGGYPENSANIPKSIIPRVVVFSSLEIPNTHLRFHRRQRRSHPASSVRLVIQAETRADDGMDLLRVETFQRLAPDQLPSEAEIAERIPKMAEDLAALRKAPVAEPFDGPALLSGRAAAVFFHEVLGHRLEGHRQRGENEGQTFTKKVNQLVLPEFLSVSDDPTMRELNGTALAGSYQYDNEGQPAAARRRDPERRAEKFPDVAHAHSKISANRTATAAASPA